MNTDERKLCTSAVDKFYTFFVRICTFWMGYIKINTATNFKSGN
jgi:hypothetical protein